jgi:hypothetical protein
MWRDKASKAKGRAMMVREALLIEVTVDDSLLT